MKRSPVRVCFRADNTECSGRLQLVHEGKWYTVARPELGAASIGVPGCGRLLGIVYRGLSLYYEVVVYWRISLSHIWSGVA